MAVAERNSLVGWLAEDPRHVAAYEECRQAWDMLEDIRAEPDILAIREKVRTRGKTRWLALSGMGLAASIALTATLTITMLTPKQMARPEAVTIERDTDFATGVGQVSRMQLPDGSKLVLDADSVIALRFSATRRDVLLQRGRAYFEVAHDAARPFVVSGDRFAVRATGTRFVVDRSGSAQAVSMVQGRIVATSLVPGVVAPPVALTAGRRLTDNGKGEWRIQAFDPDAAEGWMEGRLTFQQANLADIIDEMNRYSRRKIILSDPSLATRQVSAVLKAGDTSTLTAAPRQARHSARFQPHARRDRSGSQIAPGPGRDPASPVCSTRRSRPHRPARCTIPSAKRSCAQACNTPLPSQRRPRRPPR